MYYKQTLQNNGDCWIYVIAFGENTPRSIKEIEHSSDTHLSAEDMHGIRHYVYFKNEYIVQIQLYDAVEIIADLNPEIPESFKMPSMHAIMHGDPPVPTLLLNFNEGPPDNQIAYVLAPNVFLLFHQGKLAQLYVTDVYNSIEEVS
ncbi:hypothetical protein Pan241w_28400 [Gimesia alba]|uniref:Uncharacterized protein n=1 Tax=Gimesia alba TaxID=2527973 RepID=A0A517RFU7_9PLAN|nr:hypothetical protein [Gimesia alba]QDT42751.1 hypothetical protein Pan241w_28400 [Gimesia alba]